MKKEINQNTNLSDKSISPKIWYLFAFLEGALVIFSELIGAKMLNSFYGASLAVWTGVISVTIAFLTLGYFVGGRFSKSNSKITILKNCFALAALFVIIMPAWSEILFLKFNEGILMIDAIKVTILLIGPSVFCLGISSPIIIQLLSEQQGETGDVSGKVYGISTIAGIVATLFLGYFMLPYFGLKIPLLISALLLISISLYINPKFFNIFISILVLLIGFTSILSEKDDLKYFSLLYESEGLMGQLKVMDEDYPANDVHFRFLFINGIPQTIMYNKDKKSNSFWEYVHRMSATATLKKGKNALLIGLGGASIANELQKLDFKLDIVDIDKRMYEISQKYFNFGPKSTTTFTEDDARHYVKTCRKKYDLVIIDICSGEVQPSNLFTKEGVAEIKKILNKDGIVLIQYQEEIDSTILSGTQSIAKTFIYNNFKVYQNIEKDVISSIIVACSPEDIKFKNIDTTQFTENVKKLPWIKTFIENPFEQIKIPLSNSILLEDDKPMLEKINAKTIESWRKSTLKYYGLKMLGKK
jgi:spermidine synthase